jgi:hypothetical protein
MNANHDGDYNGNKVEESIHGSIEYDIIVYDDGGAVVLDCI